jgi:hypothetical protein
MSLKYEPASEPLHMSIKYLFAIEMLIPNPKPQTLNPKPRHFHSANRRLFLERRQWVAGALNHKAETPNPKP